MKTNSTLALTALGLALALAPAARGALLIGWYAFDATGNGEAADYVAQYKGSPAFSGWLDEGTSSWATGGSNDGIYGNSNIVEPLGYTVPPPADPQVGDGHARVRRNNPDPSAPGRAIFYITNLTSMPAQLDYIYFDLAEALEGTLLNVHYNEESIGQVVGNVAHVSGTYTDFNDFSFLIDRRLAPGDTAAITFSMPEGVGSLFSLRLDNIGVSGLVVPEPASMLALGGVIGAGLLIRRRQRR